MALIHHPDKLGDAYGEAENTYWLKVQGAYETLTDPSKKRKYDSTLPFDDSIVKKGTFTDETFYEVFNKVFLRNARFALVKPVANIGEDSTPINDVNKFYKYWNNFKSWREFAQYDEYELEEAGDRYERRWMDKENKKLRKEHEVKEVKRIMKLAALAEDNDPRIRRDLAEREAAAQKKRDEKYAFRNKKRLEEEKFMNKAKVEQVAEAVKSVEDEKAEKEKRR